MVLELFAQGVNTGLFLVSLESFENQYLRAFLVWYHVCIDMFSDASLDIFTARN